MTREWTVTISWPDSGKDLDIFTTLTVGGQTSSGVGWNNGGQTEAITVNSGGVNGVFYLVWDGDDRSSGGSETVTIYFSGTMSASSSTQIATVTPHCNYFESGSGEVTVEVNNQSGSYTISSPSTSYGERATASDPSVNVPLLAGGGKPSTVRIITVSLNAGSGRVSPSELKYLKPTSSTRYGSLPTPTPPQGYGFDGWYTAASGGTRIDDSTTLVSTNDHTIYARYVRYNINAAVEPSGGGSVTGAGVYAPGATCTLVATANQEYEFVKWTQGVSSVYVSSSPTYSFTVTQSDIYRAFFARKGDGQLIYDDATGRLICADSGELIYHDREILDH